MDKKLHITDDNWAYGSYHRIHYKKDTLYTFFQYVDVHFIWNVGMGSFTLKDLIVQRLQKQGMVFEEAAHRYQEAALQFLSRMEHYDIWPIEQIYGRIRRIRRDVLGAEVLERDRMQQMQMSCGSAGKAWPGIVEGMQTGIDQTAKKDTILCEKEAVILALCQPEYFGLMKQDVETVLSHGHQVYILVSREQGAGLPTREVLEPMLGRDVRYLPVEDESLGLRLDGISYDADLQTVIDQDGAALLVYGEEGFLHCRNMSVESIVQAIPYGYHARAMVNQLDGEYACTVYVPKHFDIIRWVEMTEKTKLSYWQLWQLWQDHGDGIYRMTPEQLYRCYPQYFLNVYENGDTCPEVAADYPIRVRWSGEHTQTEDGIPSYDSLRDQAIREYIQSQPGLTYLSTYFGKDMEEGPIPWQSEGQQEGILVHGIRIAAAKRACVINCDTDKTLRQQIKGNMTGDGLGDTSPSLQLISNFLFFLTPKLAELYNKLREDRPREQLQEKQGHLDYQRYRQGDKRVESFPLYHKAVLAKKKDGRFLLCQYALGGGALTITGDRGAEVTLSWSADAVNSLGENNEIQVYTPYLSQDGDGEGMFANSYRRTVGEGRVNLVIIQDKIHCIRRGDVVLPSIGVVVSLSLQYGQTVLDLLGLTEQEEGYFDGSRLSLRVVLEGPTQIDPQEWQQVEWAYGGGMSLIMDGKCIYEGDDGEENGICVTDHGTACLAREGWLSPLSRQTQESALHVLVKHPRTAIGIAQNGDLFVLVFSGRTRMSTGADYREMCHIAKALIPDVEAMMNVDGGGSSVLGMAVGGHFMELSYPATSMSSCAGMVRKVNTVLCLEP